MISKLCLENFRDETRDQAMHMPVLQMMMRVWTVWDLGACEKYSRDKGQWSTTNGGRNPSHATGAYRTVSKESGAEHILGEVHSQASSSPNLTAFTLSVTPPLQSTTTQQILNFHRCLSLPRLLFWTPTSSQSARRDPPHAQLSDAPFGAAPVCFIPSRAELRYHSVLRDKSCCVILSLPTFSSFSLLFTSIVLSKEKNVTQHMKSTIKSWWWTIPILGTAVRTQVSLSAQRVFTYTYP